MCAARWQARYVTAPPEMMPAGLDPTPGRFRQALGHFCTGITVITTADEDGVTGFACQAFAALSLEPPLVLFCPAQSSGTWPRIASSGHFCANVLAASQRELARVFGTPGTDKFAGVSWSPSPSGAPVLDGVLAWACCEVTGVHEAGDHYVVIGLVTALGESRPGDPLLFYRGRYGVSGPTEPLPEVVDTMLAWPRHVDWM